MTIPTPETRAELRAKAVAARDAQAAYIAMCERGEGLGSAWDARDAAQGDLEDALTPDRVIALLDSSEPVAGGEFEAKLRKLIVDYACLGPATIEELERALDAHDSAFVAVVATHARLQAERDAAVAEAGRLREAAAAALVLFIEPGEDTLTRFERIAELYRRDTGRLAPGKDIPMASSDDTPMEERRRLFDEWYNGRIACARAALAGSTS